MTVISSSYDAATRVYTIQTERVPKVCIIGCSGTDDAQARYNLQAMATQDADGIIINGDYVYGSLDSGLSTAEQLRRQIVEPLAQANCQVFFGVGNHEMEIHNAWYHDAIDQIKKLKPGGIARLLIGTNWPALAWYRKKIRDGAHHAKQFQGFLRFIQAADDPVFAGAPENPNVQVSNGSQIRKFQMPEGGYYSQFYQPQDGSDSIEYIIVNTNTLPYDEAQCTWLTERLNASTAHRIVIVGHHPMQEKTLGKRRYKKEDGYMYAEAMAEIATLDKNTKADKTQARQAVWDRFEILHGLSGSGHGDQLHYVWEQEVLSHVAPDKKQKIACSVAAHDHFTAVVGDQITLGGGGGGKLDKPVYTDDPRCLYSAKESAFGVQTVVEGELVTSLVKGLLEGHLSNVAEVRTSLVDMSGPGNPRLASTEVAYVSKDKESLNVHKRNFYENRVDGCRVTRYEAQSVDELNNEEVSLWQTYTDKADSLLKSLFSDLDSEIDMFAQRIGLKTIAPQAFREGGANLKNLHEMLISMRDFMYELRKEAIAKPKQDKEFERLTRDLIALVKFYNQHLGRSEINQFALPRDAEILRHITALKKFMKQNASSGVISSIILPLFIILSTVIVLVKLFYGNDIAFHTPESPLSDAAKIATLVGTLYAGQMGGRIQHAKVESQFDVKLGHFLSNLIKVTQNFRTAVEPQATAVLFAV